MQIRCLRDFLTNKNYQLSNVFMKLVKHLVNTLLLGETKEANLAKKEPSW